MEATVEVAVTAADDDDDFPPEPDEESSSVEDPAERALLDRLVSNSPRLSRCTLYSDHCSSTLRDQLSPQPHTRFRVSSEPKRASLAAAAFFDFGFLKS